MVLTTGRLPGIPVKRLFVAFVTLLVVAGPSLSSPAQAHKDHRKQQQLAAQQAAATEQQQAATAGEMSAKEMHETMGEMMMDPASGRAQMSLIERLLDWLGRLHPIIVHFPIAFFPAALFTAIVGRRRPAFSAPVQFLVVAGGIIAPISALLGWFSGGWTLSDTDPLLTVHRWLGTAIGVGGLLLAIWAWRRPWEDRRAGMILALTLMTIAIAAQGWFGGALVHGADHMSW